MMTEEDLEEFRPFIDSTFLEVCEYEGYTPKEFNKILQSGNVTNKNHLFSINNISKDKYYDESCVVRCSKCNLLCSFCLGQNDELIIYNGSNLSCEEMIIKNIIE